MAEPAGTDDALEPLPQAQLAPRSRLSIVWLIPVVALVIGGWLAYKTYSEQGPKIEIRFNSAAGLQAGKTKVKYKDVEVGEVTSIVVTDDLKHVLVRAQLVADAGKYLTEGTRFWVSRPRVTAGRVSGLETLLSGAYIAVDPVSEGPSARSFIGLEEPPVFTTSQSGTQYVLRAASGGSLNTGSPVYYRSIQVGQVVGSELDADGRTVDIKVFIASPNDRLVLTTTRFWNASGVDFRLDAQGVRLDTQSLLSVMIGGVAFDNPDSLEEAGVRAPENQRFPLHASHEEAQEIAYLKKSRYLMFFDGSVRGLEVDAPVLLRGIKIGQVLDIRLKFSLEEFEFLIPVLIEIEPERIGIIGAADDAGVPDVVPRLVARGLRGQLKSGSLLTGGLYVDLDFHPDAPPAKLEAHGDYRVLPTVPAPLDALANRANDVLDTLQALPLEEIGKDLRDTVKGAKALVNSEGLTRSIGELELVLRQLRQTARSLDEGAVPELNAALRQARLTLKAAEGVVSPDSSLYQELRRTLTELSSAARSIRIMTDYLERHPEALIRGKGGL